MIDEKEEEYKTFILSQVLRYADHKKEYNRNFIDGVWDYFDKYGEITDNQFRTLKAIYEEPEIQEFFN
jgi:hypothetical protein